MKVDLNSLIKSVENMAINKNENAFNKFSSALDFYGITLKELISAIGVFAKDESLLKFNELEKESLYKLNNMIKNSNISNEQKIFLI